MSLSARLRRLIDLHKPPKTKAFRRRPSAQVGLEELESRLAPASYAVNAQLEVRTVGEPQGVSPRVIAVRATQVVFFESSVANYQVLRQGLAAGTDFVLLDEGGDGLRQMAAY